MKTNQAESSASASATVSASSSAPELRGAEILVKALQAENVKYIWGYPGGAVLHIYDALYKQDTMQHILVRHEQAAVHAADGYARATGEVGVALVTSGPGATNAVTGIATAYMDSIPMVIVTGQVPTAAIGLDAFQECDTIGITRPIVKHNFLVKDARDLAETMKKLFISLAVVDLVLWLSIFRKTFRLKKCRTTATLIQLKCGPITQYARGTVVKFAKHYSCC